MGAGTNTSSTTWLCLFVMRVPACFAVCLCVLVDLRCPLTHLTSLLDMIMSRLQHARAHTHLMSRLECSVSCAPRFFTMMSLSGAPLTQQVLACFSPLLACSLALFLLLPGAGASEHEDEEQCSVKNALAPRACPGDCEEIDSV